MAGNEELLKSTGLAGTKLADSYEFLDVLGEGGHSEVFKAYHPRLDRLVAVKLLRSHRLHETAIARFEREARAMSRIHHYNVVTVYDFGVTERHRPYMVLEYLEGETLGDKIDREGPLPLDVAATILVQACNGLQEAHNHGIIHRDLKPENIVLQNKSDRADWVKVVDFGVAYLAGGDQERLTTPGQVAGTPWFFAPERFTGLPGDERSDIYSLGLVLFEMLTARSLYKADTMESLVVEVLLRPRPTLSSFRDDIKPGSAFDNIFFKATALSAERRYQSAAELRDDLVEAQRQM